ncbi:MAG: allophanate hydrolase [Ilumatobacter sp.]|nr:allophanate hydrolase [Ilumatobacter sp.]
MRYGVPRSGPMDRLAHAVANAAVGNAVDATALEISLGGLSLECRRGPVTVAVAGGEFSVRCDGRQLASWSVITLDIGQRLEIAAGRAGSWAYLAVAGEVRTTTWLGSAATHSTSGFGGGSLGSGDEIGVDSARVSPALDGELVVPSIARPRRTISVVMGPQDHHLTIGARDAFVQSSFELTPAADRMGVRLAGPQLELGGALSIPSEPIVRGSIQVAGDGVPTLLTADHQTTGGYPKIATLVSSEIDRAAQLRAPDQIRFVPVSPAEAVAAARSHARAYADALAAVASSRRTLAHRLREHNLIGDAAPEVTAD